MNDLKFAFRQLLKNPGFTAVAVLTLALGIGATSAMFCLIHGLLLTPPPYAKPEQIALLVPAKTDGRTYSFPCTTAQWIEWRKATTSFEATAGYEWGFQFVVLPDGSESVQGLFVTPDYFKVIGVKPFLGRELLPSDMAARGGEETTIILGYNLWQRRFHGDPNVLGKVVQLSRRQPMTVVGVMPRGVRFLPSPERATEPNYDVNGQVDFWIALWPSDLARPKQSYCNMVGRMREGVTPTQAQAELAAIAARQAQSDQDYSGITVRTQSLETEINREGRRLLMPMAGAVALVFLIACGNAAGLLLARGLQRQHQYAVRAALGARPLQLCRPVLMESLLLALFGGFVGAGLAVGCVNGLKLIAGAAIPRVELVRLGWPMLTFCCGAAIVAASIAGLLPAWRAFRLDPAIELKGGSRTASVGRGERRLLGSIAAAQIALTLALLVAAGLLIQTVRSLAKIRPGYDTQNILTMSVTAVGTNWLDFHTRAMERIAQLPGVKSAAFGWGLPLTGNKWNTVLEIDGQPDTGALKDKFNVPTRSVTPDYFTALGLTVIEGRGFRTSDARGAPMVTVINQALAERYFPGRNPIGRTLRLPGQTNLIEIIGIMANARTDALTDGAEPELYFSFWQSSAFSKHLVLRTHADPRTLAALVQKELRDIDPTVSVEHVKTLEQIRAESIASRTFAMNLLVGFAAVACLLATVGIYGVLSLAVGSRKTEIAIRMAVGAQRSDVLRLILRDGVRLATAGVAIGIVIALALAAALKSYLFGVRPADPLTLAGMVVVVMAITLATCWIPAHRAMRVEPLAALRNE